MNEPVVARVAALKTASAVELKQMWRELFLQDPPPFNRRFLETRLAYRIQELAYGGLKRETVKRLEKLGEQLDGGKDEVRRRRVDNRPIAGTRLIRDWQGVPCEVIVGVDHFEYQGRRYKSLSSIAWKPRWTSLGHRGHSSYSVRRQIRALSLDPWRRIVRPKVRRF